MNNAPTLWIVLALLWMIVTGRVEGVISVIRQGTPHNVPKSAPKGNPA